MTNYIISYHIISYMFLLCLYINVFLYSCREDITSHHITSRSVIQYHLAICLSCVFISTYSYIHAEKTAFLHLEPHCGASMTSMVKYNDPNVLEVLDSNSKTCFSLAAKRDQWIQISLPGIPIKGQFSVQLIGDLKCSPVNGLGVSIINDCEGHLCRNSQCIASNFVTSDGLSGCKYRWHSFSICNYITVNIFTKPDMTRTGSICEIVY